MKRFLVVCVLAGVAALMVVAGSSASTSKLVVSPTAPVVGDSLVFSGCGYTPGVDLLVQAVRNTRSAEWIFQDGVTTDGNGCFSTVADPYVVPAAGKWTASVWESGHKDATLNFSVG